MSWQGDGHVGVVCSLGYSQLPGVEHSNKRHCNWVGGCGCGGGKTSGQHDSHHNKYQRQDDSGIYQTLATHQDEKTHNAQCPKSLQWRSAGMTLRMCCDVYQVVTISLWLASDLLSDTCSICVFLANVFSLFRFLNSWKKNFFGMNRHTVSPIHKKTCLWHTVQTRCQMQNWLWNVDW